MSNRPQNFYYASQGNRQGPVTEAEFEALVSSGAIQDDSLVWNEAASDWMRLADYRQLAAKGFAHCSVSGKLGMVAEMVQFGDKFVSAEHKDAFFQSIKEGAPSNTGAIVDPQKLRELLDTEGYQTSAGSIIGRSFSLWKSNLGIAVGTIFVALAIGSMAGLIPILGWLATFFLQPHLIAGASRVLLLRFRGEPAPFEEMFSTFKTHYWRYVMAALVQLAMLIPVIVIAVVGSLTTVLGAGMANQGEFGSAEGAAGPLGALGFILIGVLVIVAMVLIIRITFMPLLIADKGVSVGDAFKLSWKATGMRFWTILASLIVLGVVAVSGVILLGVGLILTLPFAYIGTVIAYDDAFGQRSGARG